MELVLVKLVLVKLVMDVVGLHELLRDKLVVYRVDKMVVYMFWTTMRLSLLRPDTIPRNE